jgi:hypothetical protein
MTPLFTQKQWDWCKRVADMSSDVADYIYDEAVTHAEERDEPTGVNRGAALIAASAIVAKLVPPPK